MERYSPSSWGKLYNVEKLYLKNEEKYKTGKEKEWFVQIVNLSSSKENIVRTAATMPPVRLCHITTDSPGIVTC